MTHDQFTAMVQRKWTAAVDKLNNDWKKNKRRRKTLSKMLAVANYLWDNRGPDAIFSQEDIARNVPDLGFHAYFEGRVPEEVRDAIGNSLRKVRELVMMLRIVYAFPILSVAHCNDPRKDAGYWVARSQEEVDRYVCQKTSENSAVIKRRLDSEDAMRLTWNIRHDPFVREKAAWHEGEVERQAWRKKLETRIARVVAREACN